MHKLLLALFASALLCATAVPAPALSLPLPPVQLAAPEEEAEAAEAEEEAESGGDEDETAEEPFECTIEDEEDVQLCAEIAAEEREEAKAEECVLEDATARVAAHPGKGSVELKIRYRAAAPASVAIDTRLRGGKGSVHLGASHTRFRRSGVFRDTFVLGEKQMERALAARKFEVELQVVNTPRYCRLDLNGVLRRAKRPLRADARDRSGDPGRTRGR